MDTQDELMKKFIVLTIAQNYIFTGMTDIDFYEHTLRDLINRNDRFPTSWSVDDFKSMVEQAMDTVKKTSTPNLPPTK